MNLLIKSLYVKLSTVSTLFHFNCTGNIKQKRRLHLFIEKHMPWNIHFLVDGISRNLASLNKIIRLKKKFVCLDKPIKFSYM